jgi:hypothetical protein
MRIKNIKASVAVLLAVSFVLAACGFNISLGGTDTPTNRPQATREVSRATESSGTIPSTEAIASSGSTTTSGTLSATLYKNKNGGFEFYPPESWIMSGENSHAVSFSTSDNFSLVTVRYTNTGYKLDAAGFETFINGNELNRYSFKDSYTETSRDLKADQGVGTVYKSFNYNNVPQAVETIYNQASDVVFEVELWTDAAKWDGMTGLFNSFLDKVTWYPDQVSNGTPYMLVDTFYGLDNAFSYDYYQPWYPTWDYSGDTKWDLYTSPDGYAFIQSGYYNDLTTEWSTGNAGQWALDNLETYYSKNASDLKVDKDQINSKGYEYLEWHTKQGQLVGVTIFYAEGTQIELMTVAWQKSYADVYENALRYIVDTFTAPAQ